VITREQLAEHYSMSDIGHSYSVWIPWDKAGSPEKEISLIARLVTADGPSMPSEQWQLRLPGPPNLAKGRHGDPSGRSGWGATASSGVRPAAHQTTPQAPPQTQWVGEVIERSPRPRMRTTTIPVPPRFGRRQPVAKARLPQNRVASLPPTAPTAIGTEAAASLPQGGAMGSPALPPPAQAVVPESTGYPPPGPPAPAGPTAPPALGRTSWQPRPARWPSHPRSTPPPASAFEFGHRPQVGPSTPGQVGSTPLGRQQTPRVTSRGSLPRSQWFSRDSSG
jgi:hypothetical protein